MRPLDRIAASRDVVRPPLLVRPFDAGLTGWLVVFPAMLIEIGGGAFAGRASPALTVPLLVIPIAVLFGVAGVQWWQVRATGSDPASWWHLAGIAVALCLWFLAPRTPQPLSASHNAVSACLTLPVPAHSDCLSRAAQAFDYASIAWFSALGLIAVAALLARRSRIAPWAAIPTALAGSILASNMLEQLLVHFGVPG
jgi:hypothetical protein